MTDINLISIETALAAIRSKIIKTPLINLSSLKTHSGNQILIKAENLQPSSSFKIRGATYCISLLSNEQKHKGIIAYSTGNHAQSVAMAAKSLGINATIVMSTEAPQFKIDATIALGAQVIMSEPNSAARKALAEELTQAYGLSLIPPYDHIDVITGQGTMGLEILEEQDIAAVFVPIGGGGLISGVAIALKKKNSSIQVIGVEPELENDAFLSFKNGIRISLNGPSFSIADAIKVQTLGDITYPIIQRYVDDIVTVNESDIIQAITLHKEKAALTVEPSGALALAGALKYKLIFKSKKPVVCIASGGNVSPT